MSYLRVKTKLPLIFLLPAVALILCIGLFPFLLSLYWSFHEYILGSSSAPTFVGLENYARFFLMDRETLPVIESTLAIMFIALAISLGLGFLFALVINRDFPGRSIIRALFLMPLFISGVSTSIIWVSLIDENLGPFEYMLMSLLGKKVYFTATPVSARLIIGAIEAWTGIPYTMLLILAALQSIPPDLVDSAKVDGAGTLHLYRYIILPLIARVFLALIILRIIQLMQVFTATYVITHGGPGLATTTWVFKTYLSTFRYFDMGYGAAIAFSMMFVLVPFMLLYLNLVLKE